MAVTSQPDLSHMSGSWLDATDADFDESFPIGSPPRPGSLNRRVARALKSVLREIPTEDDLATKPLDLCLSLPLPPRLRFYLYLATQHESERQADTYRVQLTAGEKVGPKRYRFSRAGGVRPLLVGYVPGLDAFIMWDADVIDSGGGFTYSQGVQAPPDLVYRALAEGVADGTRTARRAGTLETIVVARSTRVVDGLLRRIELTNAALTA